MFPLSKVDSGLALVDVSKLQGVVAPGDDGISREVLKFVAPGERQAANLDVTRVRRDVEGEHNGKQKKKKKKKRTYLMVKNKKKINLQSIALV